MQFHLQLANVYPFLCSKDLCLKWLKFSLALHTAIPIIALSLILFRTSFTYTNNFLISFLSLACWLGTMDKTAFSSMDNSQTQWLPSLFWPWSFWISCQELNLTCEEICKILSEETWARTCGFSQNHRGVGVRWPSGCLGPSPAAAGTPRAGCRGPRPSGFWKSPRRLYSLWAACTSALLPTQWSASWHSDSAFCLNILFKLCSLALTCA